MGNAADGKPKMLFKQAGVRLVPGVNPDLRRVRVEDGQVVGISFGIIPGFDSREEAVNLVRGLGGLRQDVEDLAKALKVLEGTNTDPGEVRAKREQKMQAIDAAERELHGLYCQEKTVSVVIYEGEHGRPFLQLGDSTFESPHRCLQILDEKVGGLPEFDYFKLVVLNDNVIDPAKAFCWVSPWVSMDTRILRVVAVVVSDRENQVQANRLMVLSLKYVPTKGYHIYVQAGSKTKTGIRIIPMSPETAVGSLVSSEKGEIAEAMERAGIVPGERPVEEQAVAKPAKAKKITGKKTGTSD